MYWIVAVKFIDRVLDAKDKIEGQVASKITLYTSKLKDINKIYDDIGSIILTIMSLILGLVAWFRNKKTPEFVQETYLTDELTEGYGDDLFGTIVGGSYKLGSRFGDDRSWNRNKSKLEEYRAASIAAEQAYNDNRTEENRKAYEKAKQKYKNYSTHQGQDITLRVGMPLYSPFDGKVVKVNEKPTGTGGRSVTIQSSDGKYQVYLAHLSKTLVGVGDVVFKGQKVAESGASGKGREDAYGAHVHIQIKDVSTGTWINPVEFNKRVYKTNTNNVVVSSNVAEVVPTESTVQVQSPIFGVISVSKQSAGINIPQEVVRKAKKTFEGTHNYKGKGSNRLPTFVNDCNNMMKFFIRRFHIKDWQAAGILGNLIRESQLNPRAYWPGENYGAQGIAQWRGKRVKNYYKKYHNQPKDDGNLNNQMEYVALELEGEWFTCIEKLKEARSLERAADLVFGYYEFSVGVFGAVKAMNSVTAHRKNDGEYSLILGRLYAKEALLIYRSFKDHAVNILKEGGTTYNAAMFYNGEANSQWA